MRKACSRVLSAASDFVASCANKFASPPNRLSVQSDHVSIAWLLRFVAGHRLTAFVPYRVGAGAIVLLALTAGW